MCTDLGFPLVSLYVFRFKAMHPSVKGQEGSEFRMATVGLMLANKFLDDNTYSKPIILHVQLSVTRSLSKLLFSQQDLVGNL